MALCGVTLYKNSKLLQTPFPSPHVINIYWACGENGGGGWRRNLLCPGKSLIEFSSNTHIELHPVIECVLCVFTCPKIHLNVYFVFKFTVLQEPCAFSDLLYKHLSCWGHLYLWPVGYGHCWWDHSGWTLDGREQECAWLKGRWKSSQGNPRGGPSWTLVSYVASSYLFPPFGEAVVREPKRMTQPFCWFKC